MQEPKCKICNDVGYTYEIRESSLYKTKIPYWKRCVCLKQKKLRDFLGDLSKIVAVKKSDLIGYLGKNTFITASTADFKSHLKYCLTEAGTAFSYSITSDNQLLDIWLAKDSSHSLLRDFIKYDLVVVLLGNVGYGNVALAGCIFEAINNRLLVEKPTWVQTYRDFNKSQVEYSIELENLFDSHFESFSLSSDKAIKKDNPTKGKQSINDRIRGV